MCGVAGGFIGFVSAGDLNLAADTVQMVSYLTVLPWWLVMAALALFAADILFQWLLLRRREVKL